MVVVPYIVAVVVSDVSLVVNEFAFVWWYPNFVGFVHIKSLFDICTALEAYLLVGVVIATHV